MFVIRSQPRCGTHMLCSVLNQHPDLTVWGEAFSPTVSQFGPHTVPRHQPLRDQVNYVWALCDGFAAHGYHFCMRPNLRELIAERRPQIIWLQRRNKFRQALSNQLASHRNRWQAWTPEQQVRDACIQPELDPMLLFIRAEAEYSRRDAAAFRALPQLSIWYEDLVERQEETLQRIWTFLQVPPAAGLAPKTYRTFAHDDLSRYVPEWEHLQAEFYKRLLHVPLS